MTGYTALAQSAEYLKYSCFASKVNTYHVKCCCIMYEKRKDTDTKGKEKSQKTNKATQQHVEGGRETITKHSTKTKEWTLCIPGKNSKWTKSVLFFLNIWRGEFRRLVIIHLHQFWLIYLSKHNSDLTGHVSYTIVRLNLVAVSSISQFEKRGKIKRVDILVILKYL